MLVLETITDKRLWGGHLYSVFCRKGISNRILNGKQRGKSLNDVFPDWKTDFQMEKYLYFPLTLALTNAEDNLSIQVHPNDEMASELEHLSRGKRESWYFLKAPKTGTIINGCRERDIAKIHEAVKRNAYDDIMDYLPVDVGDYVFVEPGTLHSISAGSLVYEIEEGADFTYRFYDFNRRDGEGKLRELHTEKALQCLKPDLKSVVRKYPSNNIIHEKTYSTEIVQNRGGYVNESRTVSCFTLIDGKTFCDGIALNHGMTALLFPGEEVDCRDVQLAFVSQLEWGV